jgi:hypothetical protein
LGFFPTAQAGDSPYGVKIKDIRSRRKPDKQNAQEAGFTWVTERNEPGRWDGDWRGESHEDGSKRRVRRAFAVPSHPDVTRYLPATYMSDSVTRNKRKGTFTGGKKKAKVGQ